MPTYLRPPLAQISSSKRYASGAFSSSKTATYPSTPSPSPPPTSRKASIIPTLYASHVVDLSPFPSTAKLHTVSYTIPFGRNATRPRSTRRSHPTVTTCFVAAVLPSNVSTRSSLNTSNLWFFQEPSAPSYFSPTLDSITDTHSRPAL